MRWRTLDEINRTALLELVDNQVCEDRHLEYKEELPGSSDEDKREFLADVSAFANGGGHRRESSTSAPDPPRCEERVPGHTCARSAAPSMPKVT